MGEIKFMPMKMNAYSENDEGHISTADALKHYGVSRSTKKPEGSLWLLEADLFRRTSLFMAHQAALRELCMAAECRKAA